MRFNLAGSASDNLPGSGVVGPTIILKEASEEPAELRGVSSSLGRVQGASKGLKNVGTDFLDGLFRFLIGEL